eukprot:TRINITY_DN9661_c1_g1_i13.p1 TRINITY_DN9661_c1_g1~~TRINITY_DN9661_c1_g1_i13.p1  ORF type:complete len:872 (-),score=195.20 TRINITY_DN9661_c1_g1_i13:248-2617(-)
MSMRGFSRLGAALSVLDFARVGSSLSLRSFARVGSSFSVFGITRLGSTLAVLDFSILGSSMSLRGFARLGSALSVLDYLRLGASLSLRSFARIGSAVSLFGLARLGSVFSLSVLENVRIGSSLALRSFARVGSALSVLDYLRLGASLSLRSFARIGSAVSLFGLARLGSVFSLSVLENVRIGSSLALRSFARVGSAVAVLDFLRLGSTMSLRSFTRVGSAVSLFGLMRLGSVFSLSVLDVVNIGSSLSLRSFGRLGSALSILSHCFMGSSLSLRTYIKVGSSISVQATSRAKDLVANNRLVFGTATGGSAAVSQGNIFDMYAQQAEVHGSLVAGGGAVLGSELGSEIKLDGSGGENSIRYSRAGGFVINAAGGKRLSYTSANGPHLHGSWNAEGPLVLKHPSSELLIEGVKDGSPASIASIGMDHSTSRFRMKVNGHEVMSTAYSPSSADTSAGQSQLHGSWISNSFVTVSDSRMKTDIKPLRGDMEQASNTSAAWLLRQLRPVSFRYRPEMMKGQQRDAASGGGATAEDDRERYGFLADEVRKIIPDIVRNVTYGDVGSIHAMAYQDLMALAVAGLQAQQERLEQLEARVELQQAQQRDQQEEQPEAPQLQLLQEQVQQLKQQDAQRQQEQRAQQALMERMKNSFEEQMKLQSKQLEQQQEQQQALQQQLLQVQRQLQQQLETPRAQPPWEGPQDGPQVAPNFPRGGSDDDCCEEVRGQISGDMGSLRERVSGLEVEKVQMRQQLSEQAKTTDRRLNTLMKLFQGRMTNLEQLVAGETASGSEDVVLA